ncbi:MAG: YbjN domain-containing protein [Planctomycetaceae bacterium]
MPDDLLTTDNLSKELLKSILDAAFMETTYDSDGDLNVKENNVNCIVMPNLTRKDRVQLMALFRFEQATSELQRLQATNRINAEYIIVRAVVGSNGVLRFTWDIPIAGGITNRAFVLAVKRFCSIPHDALADCAKDVVA